jgi:hypothetical protein
MQTKAPYDDGTSKKGDLYSKSGKNACMTIVFELLQEKSSMRSSKIVEKERSIVLMITKNRF